MFKHLSEYGIHSGDPAHTTDAHADLSIRLCTWFSDAFVQMRSHLVSSCIGQFLLCPIFQRTIFPGKYV